jgi:hypothetical protein
VCFVQSTVKKCTVHFSLLKKPLLAWHIMYRRPYSSKTEVPPTSTVRFVSTWTQCYQDEWIGRSSGNDQPLLLWPPRSPDIMPCDFFCLGICRRPGIRPTIATWAHWPTCTDHCSGEEYRCTDVDACVPRTLLSYRCVPCHPWCTRRTSLVVKKKKKLFQLSCCCEQFH